MKLILLSFILLSTAATAQNASIRGKVTVEGKPALNATIHLEGTAKSSVADSTGSFVLNNIPSGNYALQASYIGFDKFEKSISLKSGQVLIIDIVLHPAAKTMSEVVITGVSKATLLRENLFLFRAFRKSN